MGKHVSRERRNALLGVAFLAPNILGFLAFTVVPLVFSLLLAFSNWDLRLHNMFKDESIRFVFFDNFIRLFNEVDFYRFLGNTLFLMMGIPVGIAGSLGAAILLTQDTSGGSRRVHRHLLVGAVLLVSVLMLVVTGLHGTAFTLLLCGLAGLFLIGGIAGGNTVYRTLFFIPHFTSGVAVYILWKKLYNPSDGPINNFLSGPLLSLGDGVNSLPATAVQLGAALLIVIMAFIASYGLWRLAELWRDGALGHVAAVPTGAMLLLPCILSLFWCPAEGSAWAVFVFTVLALVAIVVTRAAGGREFGASLTKGFGDAFMLALVLMVAEFVFLGLGSACYHLPAWSAEGLTPPPWLAHYHWAKPAIMVMGLWGAIGSNNMLLYIAGLSNVPSELYEAADIDGASRFQRFWHVTWPQLAPVTFFIFIMSVIGGLQGGFEMARTMTGGGPAGATTTLSYFIYNEGFSTGRLGYASGIAWTLFAMVFTCTMFNWKFGSRYVND